MNKKGLGGIVLLGGIAFIGFVWFRRNKPDLASSQLSKLTNLSNNLGTSADIIDKNFEYSQSVKDNLGSNPYIQSTLSSAEQAQVNQAVKENIDCGLLGGLASLQGIDCSGYNAQQQQMANPNNVDTTACTSPKLFITNVKRWDAGFPNPSDSGSLWKVYYNFCGIDKFYEEDYMYPLNVKITVTDSIGSQTYAIDKYIYKFDSFGFNLPRRTKSAVVIVNVTDAKGKSYVQTFNYKE